VPTLIIGMLHLDIDPYAMTTRSNSNPRHEPPIKGDVMTKKRKGSVTQVIFDDFLANQRMLEACEDHAIKELIAEQLAGAGTHDLARFKGEAE
jgi:hypothetical protein